LSPAARLKPPGGPDTNRRKKEYTAREPTACASQLIHIYGDRLEISSGSLTPQLQQIRRYLQHQQILFAIRKYIMYWARYSGMHV